FSASAARTHAAPKAGLSTDGEGPLEQGNRAEVGHRAGYSQASCCEHTAHARLEISPPADGIETRLVLLFCCKQSRLRPCGQSDVAHVGIVHLGFTLDHGPSL